MIQTTQRPLTDDEHADLVQMLRDHVRPRPEPHRSLDRLLAHAWNGFLYGCTGAFLLLLLGKPVVAAGICVAVAVVARVAFYLSQPSPRELHDAHRDFLFDQLRRNRIRETTVIASAVAKVEATGWVEADTKTGYFFDIGNGEVLFLREESLPVEVPQENATVSLPSVFTMTQYLDSEEPVQITAAGPDLPVSRIVYYADEDVAYDMEEGRIFPASLATLEQDLAEYVSATPPPA